MSTFAIVYFFICGLCWMIPYSANRKSGWHIFNKIFEIYNPDVEIILSAPRESYDWCIYGFHPHGVLPVSIWMLGSYFPFSLPNAVTQFGSQVSIIPCFKALISIRGQAVVADRKNIDDCLAKKKSVILCPGGVQEMLRTHIDPDYTHIITYHLGFIKYAIKHGCPVVPVVSMNEDKLYYNPGNWIEWVTYHLFKVPACPIYVNKYGFPLGSLQKAKIIVGSPIQTCDRDVKDVANEFYTQWKEIYIEHSSENHRTVQLIFDR